MKSIRNDERGLGHFLVYFLVVAVIAAIGIVGYRVLHKEDTPTDKTAKARQASDQANCMKVYHDKTLCTFAVNNTELSNLSYTAVDNSADSMGQATKITVKNDGKGNTSVNSDAGNQSYDSVTTGNTIYVNANDTGWIKYTSNAPNTPNVTNPTVTLKLDFSDKDTPKNQRVEYKKQGQEKCGNATCEKYKIENSKAAGTNYIWINTGNNRLMRWTSKSADGTNDVVITYGAVTITPPANATDVTQAANQINQTDNLQAQQQSGVTY